MKKNLRIVSAAAAALLAVAPVAAAAVVPANAEVEVSNQQPTSVSNVNEPGVTSDQIVKKLTPAISNSSVWQADGLKVVNYTTTTKKDGNETANQQVSYNLKYTGTKASSVTAAKLQAIYNKVTGKTGTTTGLSLDKDGYLVHTYTDKNGKKQTKKVSGIAHVTDIKVAKNAADTSAPNIVAKSFANTIFAEDPNTAVTISAVAGTGVNGHHVEWGNTINGNIVATIDGKQYTALLHGDNNTTVYPVDANDNVGKTAVKTLVAGQEYAANFSDVTENLGNAYAGKSVKFVLPRNAVFANPDKKDYANVKTVKVDSNGIADLGTIVAKFYAYDPTDLQEIHFYSQKTGNIVTSGSVDLHAVNMNGKLELNVNSVFAAMTQEYVASQLDYGKNDKLTKALTLIPQNDLRDQLKKQNITVDPQGYFTAPKSFTVNLNATSQLNGATATLPVTVNVDNAAASTTTANEQTTTKTIMHIATIYDKNGKATNEPVLRAYNSVSVVSTPVELKDASGKSLGRFYKLAGKDEYIKVGNIDGTSRSLKHNSYVYKANGKPYMKSKKHHEVLKSGASVTTYGKSFKNDVLGTQVYRIGRNRYVKVANFR